MNLSDAKVLIGDDSILARKQLRDKLTSWGVTNFVDAANGQEAVEKFKEEKPDIVFLDIVMPVIDGIEATRQMKEIDSSAFVIMVSSIGTQSQLKRAIVAGAKDFIQKPLNAEQLLNILKINFDGIEGR